MGRRKIKINFCDYWNGYDQNNNIFTSILIRHYDIEVSENPDFLFYSCFGNEHLKYNDCVKIFYTGENVLPNFNECDYAIAFDYFNFGDRYFHKCPFLSRAICNRNVMDESYFNRKFCNFIYSNTTSGEGCILRQEFCKKLMQYKHVDCPGKVLNNMSAVDLEPRNGNWEISKLEFLKKYKFTIAFENSCSNGYTTEKLIHPLQSLSVPIYWGNPLVTKDFNTKAFINCNDYDNDFDAVIERIKELDNDPDKYLAMLRENPMQPDFDFNQDKKFEQWLLKIIEKGNKPFNSDPRSLGTVARLSSSLQTELNKLNTYETLLSDIKKYFVTMRIDIFCADDNNKNFLVKDVILADWMKKFGQYGYCLQETNIGADYDIEVLRDTTLNILLRGPDNRDENNKTMENWVDFTSLIINDKEILSQTTPVWHNKPFTYTFSVNKGENIHLHAEWKKHKK